MSPRTAVPHRPGRRLCALALVAAQPWSLPPAAGQELREHPLLPGCGSAAASCTQALETVALREHPQLARREGRLLWVTVTTGQAPLRLEDPADGSASHHYLGPIPGTNLQLVVQGGGQGAPRFLPLGPGMGGAVRFNAPPWPSPEGRLLAVAVPARAGQVGQLALWGRVGRQWRMLYNFDPDPGMGFEFKGWRADGAALRLTWQCPKQNGATQLRDGPYGWDLVPPPPARCGD